jgi:ABC-2 type transport system ATP-binding protein
VRLPVAAWDEVEPLLAELRQAGCTLLDMEMTHTDLEQVFLRIMREEAA